MVPLPEAAKILQEAGRYGFEHSVSAFARYMGHSTTNSGTFRQRLAAFRDWKLIAGRGDTVVFTDTAKIIAHPPDERAGVEALQTAYMNCACFPRARPQRASQRSTMVRGAVIFEVRLNQPVPAAVFTQLGVVVKEVEALAARLRELVADPASA